MSNQPLDALPLWSLYLLTILLMLVAMEAGYRLTRNRQQRHPAQTDGGVGVITAATLALLAFLLAFVVSFAAGIFHERRAVVVKEVNAIGTAYLRAGYLDEPYRTESRDLLREYVDVRLSALNPANLATASARSEAIHDELWTRAEVIARAKPDPITGLYISALNDVIDAHTERINIALAFRVPTSLLLGIYVVAFLTMFLVGMQSGYLESRNVLALMVLILILSVIFMLIVDLDRSRQGLLQIPMQSLLDLQRQMQP